MIIIRPMTLKDISALTEFPLDTTLGMTNLPRDRVLLEQKIIHSENCFRQNITKPSMEEYYFVMEDLSTGFIAGTCGILAENSLSRGYYYKIETMHNHVKHHASPKILKLMQGITHHEKASEVCSLYIHPSFRHGGHGRLLSLSRYLFIAAHKNRFEKDVVVELRGYQDQNQSSPFWESVGRHFCNLSFMELMENLEHDKAFIPEILPQYPIYIDLLPEEAQEVIGKPHEKSKPALAMLLQEGFTLTDEVDLFDAGPVLSAKLDEIRTVKNSSVVTIKTTSELLEDEMEYILGNEKINFRACLGKLKLTSSSKALINDKVAEALLVDTGDKIRYVTAK